MRGAECLWWGRFTHAPGDTVWCQQDILWWSGMITSCWYGHRNTAEWAPKLVEAGYAGICRTSGRRTHPPCTFFWWKGLPLRPAAGSNVLLEECWCCRGGSWQEVCVRAMSKFLTLRQYGPSGPLFTLSSGVYLTRSSVSPTMKSLLRTAGINPETFSNHSLRIGAATAAAEAGLPDRLIKTLGRWHSHAYQTYIRTSPEVLLKAAKRITQAQWGTLISLPRIIGL